MIIFFKKASLYGKSLMYSLYKLDVKQLENLAELTNVDVQIFLIVYPQSLIQLFKEDPSNTGTQSTQQK